MSRWARSARRRREDGTRRASKAIRLPGPRRERRRSLEKRRELARLIAQAAADLDVEPEALAQATLKHGFEDPACTMAQALSRAIRDLRGEESEGE